ncbi:MAG: pyridoxal phosphate-dependent aminotransferase [Anaerolineales bacterium]
MLKEALRFHMNEMPYPPPPYVREAARQALARAHRYADGGALQRLQARLADYAGVPARHVILSPGSDLLLREIIHTFSPGRKVVTVSPSFFPTVEATRQFAPHRLSLRLRPPAFDLNVDLLLDALDEASLVIIDNPNNPTGRILLDRQAVAALTARPETLLVIDEAYFEFSGMTFADQVAVCPHLAVIRTMDKAFGLAGLRVGYALVGEAFGEALSAFPALLPRPSLEAALAALQDVGYMKDNVRRVSAERERLGQALSDLGVRVYPSRANFLLMRAQLPDVASRLEEAGVRVSDVSNQLPPGFIRVSVGTREENDAFLSVYETTC